MSEENPEGSESQDSSESRSTSSGSFKFDSGRTVASEYSVVRGRSSDALGEFYDVELERSKMSLTFRWVPGVPEEKADSLRSLDRLPSRHLVSILDFREVEGGVGILTEPYPRTLREHLRERTKLSPERAGDWVTCILEALAALESFELFPSFVSPESVAVWNDGVALDEYYMQRLFNAGTQPIPLDRAPYLAPDLEPADHRPQDALYGVGATLHEMLTGRPPLSGPPFEVIARALHQDYTVDVGGPLGDLIRKLLAPKAAQRFRRAEDVLRALEDLSTVPEFSGAPVVEAIPGGGEPESQPVSTAATSGLESAGKNDQGLPVFLRQPGDVRMVLIPGATFAMGSEKGPELKRKNEAPVIQVTVGAFLIDETPVIWEDLMRLLEKAPSDHALNQDRQNSLPGTFGGDRDPGYDSRWYNYKGLVDQLKENQPAVMISHDEAEALASALGFKLPSEAQWELAYRAGTTTEYYWGDAMDADKACSNLNSEDLPEAVRQFEPNPFGLFDMAGNVAEHCRDYYHKDLYQRVQAGEGIQAEDLAGGITESANRYSLRGGSWESTEKSLRAAFRADIDGDKGLLTAGFRLVIDGWDAPDWAKSAFEGAGD